MLAVARSSMSNGWVQQQRKYIYLNQTLRNNNQEIHISFDDVRFCHFHCHGHCHCHRPVSMWFVSFPSFFFLCNILHKFKFISFHFVSCSESTILHVWEPTFMHFEKKNAIQMHFHNDFFFAVIRSFVRWLVWASPSECIRSVFICKRISHFWNW